jgi:hypothetical protein
MTTASFHIHGFWYHVSRISSNVFRDQHSNLWIKENNRFYSEFGGLVSAPIQDRQKGWISADDLFLRDREYYNERYRFENPIKSINRNPLSF